MGFEQLAALRDQLAKKPDPKPAAKTKSDPKPAAKNPRPRRPAPPPEPRKPVDPVVLTIGKLQKRFPLAFPRNPAPKVPLKIGIFEDLMAHSQELGVSEAELREALKTWCRGSRYWACLVEDAARVDLAGVEAGRVQAADATRALRLKAARAARAPKTETASKPTDAAVPAVAEPAASSDAATEKSA